jgi:hypothetical protein
MNNEPESDSSANDPKQEYLLDPKCWTNRLAHCVELELFTWFVRMSGDRIRCLAIDCAPWFTQSLIISFLTEREQLEGTKWSTAGWRFFDFTSGPNTSWP